MADSLTEVIDLHIHGIDGLDTREGDPEAIAGIAEREGVAGVSAVLLSIYSGSVPAMRCQIEAVRVAMEGQRAVERAGSAFHEPRRKDDDRYAESCPATNTSHGPAVILGVHLEGPFLNPVMAGALDPSSFIRPSEKAFRRITEGFERIVRTVTIAPELEGASGLIKVMAASGVLVNMGHSDATFAEAEAGFLAGAKGVTHIFNAMRRFHHREPGLSGFALLNDEVYVEAIGDLNHMSREALHMLFRTKGPERIVLVSDSVKESSVGLKRAPVGEDGRLLGGASTLVDVTRLLIERGFDPDVVARSVTANPRRFLSLASKR